MASKAAGKSSFCIDIFLPCIERIWKILREKRILENKTYFQGWPSGEKL